MIIFRPHRRSLNEAMLEAKEFNSIEEMKAHIVKIWNKDHNVPQELFAKDIIINKKLVINDERTGWKNSMYVCITKIGDEQYTPPICIGICATEYK